MPGAPVGTTPTATPLVLQNALPTPTPAAVTPAGVAPVGPQAAVEQIGRVAESVGQVVRDPSLAPEQKAQQITSLASQFNQLVAQWQQQTLPAGAVAPPLAITTPTPIAGAAGGVPPLSPLLTPTSATIAPAGTATSADQLRSQIAAVTQAMNAVSQDPSLSPEARVQQLNNLSTQFNQLLRQLQQLGG